MTAAIRRTSRRGPVRTAAPIATLLSTTLLATLLTTWLVPAAGLAQSVAFTDVNPDSSNTDVFDPGGASGGRIHQLGVVPGDRDRIYAASEWGGLYLTEDGGLNWSYLAGHGPQALWDVEVDPSNPQRVFATSFFDGHTLATSRSGINRSSDGGVTWSQASSATPPQGLCLDPVDRSERAAYGIAIAPDDSSRVYVGTSCGIAISTDSGDTWTWRDPTPGDGGADRLWDVLATGSGVIHACGDDGHVASLDGGVTWTVGSGLASGRCSLAASPDEPYVLFAVVGTTLYETTNGNDPGGATWTAGRQNPVPQGRIPFVATNPRGTVRGAGGAWDLWFGDVSLYRVGCTTPAAPAPGGAARCGTTGSHPWQGPYTRTVGGHDDVGDLAFDPEATTDACPVLLASDGGVYWNQKSGPDCHAPEWEQPMVSPHGLWLFSMSGAVADDGATRQLYFGNQDNGVFGTLDVDADPPEWNNDICCDGFDVASEGAQGVYTVCCFYDGGRWSRVFRAVPGVSGPFEIANYPPGGLLPAFVFPDALAHIGDGRYVLATRDCVPGEVGCNGGDGGVFVTDDIEASPVQWVEQGAASEPPTHDACAVYAGVEAGGQATFYLQRGTCNQDTTTDRMYRKRPGQPWQEIVLPGGGFGVFAVDPANPERLLAASQTTTSGQVYSSQNGGVSWTAMPALQQLMTGNGTFPFRNRRGPTNFTGQNGYWQPSLLAFDPASDLVIAGAQDSGVFLSSDDGATWRLVTDPMTPAQSGVPHLPRPRYATFLQHGGATSIYIGTQGRGVWRLEVGDELFRDGFESGDSMAWSATTL
ncbi:MAG: hypothetical protein DWQ36_17400 [Acidobacteria bacterium]|nr:MAG: hypothetical protein DWQ30_05495 [Acidobacteriota bacterium]REK04622.1 MAG: hypothetical protein DWQ36_17400 [Acidobacteriota bacterium]